VAKKAMTWGGVAFVVFFITNNPDGAANVAKALGGLVLSVFGGFGDFFSNFVE
jgi:hypothetical protein